MKLKKILFPAAIAALFSAGVALAGDEKPAAGESKPAKCCAKAASEGKDCGHACCVEAAEAGKNCDKCGGAGTMEAKKQT